MSDQAAVLTAPPRYRGLRVVGRVLLIVLASAIPLATAAVGYYAGTNQGTPAAPAPTPLATWTDRELRPTGTQNILTLRCTYNLADGTKRIRESVVYSYQPEKHFCPASP